MEVIYSTFDELPEHHKRVSEMVLERAKRLVEHGRDVMTTLKALNDAGTTIVMVTHSQKDAQYANRVINLFDGLVVDSLKDKM